jgi:hypothetical protein
MATATGSVLPLVWVRGRPALAVAASLAAISSAAAIIWLSIAPWRARRRRRAYNSGVASRDGNCGRVCVVCSGSVAAVKAAELCAALLARPEVECVDLVLTRAGAFFQVRNQGHCPAPLRSRLAAASSCKCLSIRICSCISLRIHLYRSIDFVLLSLTQFTCCSHAHLFPT